MRQHLKRYLGMGLTTLLALAALFIPQGWFVLRDGTLMDRVQGEELSPLMVAQLDHSYEQDLHERMSICLAAVNAQDVMCSAKEIDPGNEVLWENISQAKKSLLMEALEWNVAQLMDDEEMKQFTIESCVQYALMRKSDGELLLVANDILLDKGDGYHMELLLDGVDGTVYYLESEENSLGDTGYNWRDNTGEKCWQWWRILNTAYDTEEAKLADIEALPGVTNERIEAYDTYDGLINLEELTAEEQENLSRSPSLFWAGAEQRVKMWHKSVYDDNYVRRYNIYCCLLAFGDLADSWTMELEWKPEDGIAFRRIRMGLPWVVRAIPDMAERISLTEYRDIYQVSAY